MLNEDISTQPTEAGEQYDLGYTYVVGRGVPQDYDQAIKWYTKSAEQGHSNAQISLGWAYENGQGVPRDSEQAVKWFTKAAEQGNSYAQFCLEGLISRE